MIILDVQNLKKVYTTRFGGNRVEALKNVNFMVEEGEYVAIMGESGSGKTTLLNILAALDSPTSGEVTLRGKSLSSIKDSQLAQFRRENLGFVFRILTCWIILRCGTIFICHWYWRADRSVRWKHGSRRWRRSWAFLCC